MSSTKSTVKYRVGIVTCYQHANLASDDLALTDAFKKKNIYSIKVCVWNNPDVNWEEFHCLVFRSVWDYVEHYDSFMEWLAKIKKSKIYCLNAPDIIKWNTHKRYLCDLHSKKINTIPTLYVNSTTSKCIHGIDNYAAHKSCPKTHCTHSKSSNNQLPSRLLVDLVESGVNEHNIFEKEEREFVFKPCVGANSYGAFRFSLDDWQSHQTQFEQLSSESDMMIQPFAPSIMTEGELSFIFFNCQFSHSINKRTARGEFRVQPEFGGTTRELKATFDQILQAQKAINVIKKQFNSHFLYARIDMILYKDKLCIGETELFEPTLYFENDESLTSKFVDVITLFMDQRFLQSPGRFIQPQSPSTPCSGNTTPSYEENSRFLPSSPNISSEFKRNIAKFRPPTIAVPHNQHENCDPIKLCSTPPSNHSPKKRLSQYVLTDSTPPSPGSSVGSNSNYIFWSQSPLTSPK
ncbi:hypothetical protein DFA_06650 [Cavenderia fasciculata]|uniref:ATP-grasp domain-containing protein n=1 Tax=Cavenderia fasciculata TaxID=261658 RepID=F4Q1W4_CACFS|nr:uncharacterized protein DFA_06650 [Cavenderia fasciculata]EGG17984.1 hypothetical protein DFA_06650 [Cavenderia fasciculata]|eukprot:XP_004356876.1 hypothetical protein DFA_06650 [Cavenderia fasciculata]